MRRYVINVVACLSVQPGHSVTAPGAGDHRAELALGTPADHSEPGHVTQTTHSTIVQVISQVGGDGVLQLRPGQHSSDVTDLLQTQLSPPLVTSQHLVQGVTPADHW